MTNKISKSEYSGPWGTGANLTHFHNIQFEGDPVTYNIGAKTVNPPFLQPGQSLDWEWKDQSKNSIKKAKPAFNSGGNGGVQTFVPKLDDIRISTGLIAATILYSAGKITKEQIDDIAVNVARKFDSIKASL